jgi:DNA repair protein SbcD/Mre11
MMRLSAAGIRTLLLVGNHDLSPAMGRATALQEYDTLQVPHIFCAQRPTFLGPDQLEGLPLQILALPWVSRSTLMADPEPDRRTPTRSIQSSKLRLKELVEVAGER